MRDIFRREGNVEELRFRDIRVGHFRDLEVRPGEAAGFYHETTDEPLGNGLWSSGNIVENEKDQRMDTRIQP